MESTVLKQHWHNTQLPILISQLPCSWILMGSRGWIRTPHSMLPWWDAVCASHQWCLNYVLFVKYFEKSPGNWKPEAQNHPTFYIEVGSGEIFPKWASQLQEPPQTTTKLPKSAINPLLTTTGADWDLSTSEIQQQAQMNHLQKLSSGLKNEKGWEIPAEHEDPIPKLWASNSREANTLPKPTWKYRVTLLSHCVREFRMLWVRRDHLFPTSCRGQGLLPPLCVA